MTFRSLLAETIQVLTQGLATNWLAILLALLGGLATLFPDALASSALVTLALLLCVIALVSAQDESKGHASLLSRVPNTLISAVLVGFILLFLGVMTLLASGLAAFAIMSGSGFDFDTASQGTEAFEAAMAAYQETPGWQLAMTIFLVALVLFLGAVARSLPFAAASAVERRAVALEAFNWSRKNGARLLGAMAIFCGAPLLVAYLVVISFQGAIASFSAAILYALAIYGWSGLSLASYRLLAQLPAN